jgi:hypothetical protein
MLEALLAGGLSLVGGWAGAYIGAYLKKKGENLATHEDIDKLVDQVGAVTKTTKEIEAKISSDVWTQQKRWEMKREVLFGAAKVIVELDDCLVTLDSLRNMDDPDGDKWVEHKHKATTGFREALRKLDETKILITIVCSKETIMEFESFGGFVHEFGRQLVHGETKKYRESRPEISERMVRIRFVIRKELGIEISTAASAAK